MINLKNYLGNFIYNQAEGQQENANFKDGYNIIKC